ncbi:MAG: ribonuclease P protein component [Hyphomicrobiaceae bacterium]|nr:ribonuclease P protein component [Hyphomicrobiaceae bacterium]
MSELPERRPSEGTPPEERPGPGRAARSATRIETLKRRAEFLAVRNGARWANPYFALEAMRRPVAGEPRGARFGFTVSRKVGGAVDRNRIKRRLKAAVSLVQAGGARPDFDYVLIARQPAREASFGSLVAELEKALSRVNAQKPGRAGRRPPRQGKAP